MKPYTYLIKCKTTNKSYYGVRWGNKVDPEEDLWVKYFTSSKYVKELLNKYGRNNFSISIRKTFDSKIEAIKWEETVLRRLDVLNKPDIWLNKCINKAIRYSTHPRLGVKCSDETKLKISNSNKGKPKFTQEQKDLMSKNRSGSNHWNYNNKWSDEVKKKNSTTNKQNWNNKTPEEKLEYARLSSLRSSKNWLLETPEGNKIEVNNLNKFCKENKLHASNLHTKGFSKGYKLLKKLS